MPDLLEMVAMNAECLVCANEAHQHYTLVLDADSTFEDQVICDTCVSELRQEAWIEIIQHSASP